MQFGNWIKLFIEKIILPRSPDKDQRRKEFILNILLVGLITLSGVALIINIVDPLLYPQSKSTGNPLTTGIIFIFFCLLFIISKKGKGNISASIFIVLLLIVGVYENYYWGSDLSVVSLVFTLTIIMAGILIGTRSAFLVTLISGISILVFTQLQILGVIHPNIMRKTEQIHMTDSVVYSIIFGIIALVSWLSNREIEKSLKRARSSEAALKRQRDKLEITVEKRTRQLKLAQAEKLAQMYRFAQFGRMASGLFHDLVNPLNLVSLNLDRLRRQSKKMEKQKISDIAVLLKRAVNGTQRLERFVQAARRQVQHQEVLQTFSLKEEVDQTIQMLERRAVKSHVKLLFKSGNNMKMFGNPVKFSQLVTNLVSNAIDVYETTKRKIKLVEVRLQKIDSSVRLEVQDWGSGIKEKDLPKIFDPLFTTKSIEKGTGMGLSICKDVVEKDFKGKCTVKSQRGVGTTFIVEFPIKKTPKSRS